MKTKVFSIILLSLSTLFCFAQTDDYSKDLNTAIEKLADGDCDGAQTYYNIYKGLAGNTKPYLEKQISDCKADKLKRSEKKKPKIDLMDNSYCRANKNRYVAWNIAGAGYPWNLVTGIEFRGGGIVGVGLYGDIGMDFTYRAEGYYTHASTDVNFRYAGGVKFYPYRGLFLDCGYGTICPTSVTANQKLEKSHGVLFHAGYNLVTDLSNGAGFFLGLSGGASYDVINKVFAPSVNLKIGVAWGWHK